MVRTLVVIVACLVATELAFGEVHARLGYNTQKHLRTELTDRKTWGSNYALPSETRELFGDYSTQSPALNPVQPCSYELCSGI